jgi:hypothetical protein
MILGLWVIDQVVLPMEFPGVTDAFLIGLFKFGISGGLVLFWLWLWREIVKRMFWHTVKTQ